MFLNYLGASEIAHDASPHIEQQACCENSLLLE